MVVGDFAVQCDLLVIGSGPGGYVAAIRAAQLGCSVTVVERDFIGGTCLNVGCIPSKALIQAGHHAAASRTPGLFGITNAETTIDFAATQRWKDEEVVARLVGGVSALLKKNGVEVVRGDAHFVNPHTVRVVIDDERGQSYSFKNCIIATGSRPVVIPPAPPGERILDSTGILSLKEIPERLVIVGGGYIGMELAGAYADLGSDVTILEGLDTVLAGFEKDLVQPVVKAAKSRGINIITGAMLTSTECCANGVLVTYERDGQSATLSTDFVGVCVGRTPNLDDLGIEMAGLETDEKGLLPVNEQGRTAVKGIYAIGDVVAGVPLAHKASYEGKVAAAAICGDKAAAVDYLALPTVCYTSPEIATVGMTRAQATDAGYEVGAAKFPLGGNGRLLTLGEAGGFIRLVTDKSNGRILGAQVVCANASDLIAELGLAIENLMTAEDVVATIHAHPTISESIMDTAEVALGRAIHQ